MNQVTTANLERKSVFVNDVQFHEGLPLFSFIDLNITELCNRKCSFCPRVDSDKYPNQNLNMSLDLVRKMARELQSYGFKGIVNICGYGEPLLYKEIVALVRILSEHGIHTELVTNGDKLTAALAQSLQNAGLVKIVVSMYDGPHQIEYFKQLLAGVDADFFVLRDRWYDETQEFGLILTNRAGTLPVNRPNAFLESPCYYTHYSMTIDWNGDALLCVQDWNKKVKMGNLFGQTLFEVWTATAWNRYRTNLTLGNRGKLDPCRNCDVNGSYLGKAHSDAWVAARQKSTSEVIAITPTPS